MGMMLEENLNAVNRFFHDAQPKTDEAKRLQSDWSKFWIEKGDPDNYMFLVPDEVWDEARNRKAAFERANAVTPLEKENVERVLKSGMTTELLQGKEDRRDPTTGLYHVPTPPLIPTQYKMIAVVTGVAVTALAILRKLRIL